MQARHLAIPPDLLSNAVWRILIVDDEPETVEILLRTLQRLDHVELATASDGFVAGLQLATFKPHLLVLDLMMPQIDGFEVCRIVRRSPASAYAKILVVTAFGDHENIKRALQAGANDFMHKPIDLLELGEKVKALLKD
jgi:DNA-binding response OmpR family regulator